MNEQDSMKSLEDRLASESAFHDVKYSAGEEAYPKHYSVKPTLHVYQQLRSQLGDIRGKSVLEYGCGEGWITSDLASMGANVSAFDVSPQAIENTDAVLRRAGLSGQCRLDVMPAERLAYGNEEFDVAVGFAIIHHLDLEKALAELHRVMKPGGVAYFAEPLGTNPAIQLYRKLTPQYRTPDERPLYLGELPSLLERFSRYSHREYFVTALAATGLAYLPGGKAIYPPVSKGLHWLDGHLLRLFPPLGNWGWYTIIQVVK